MDLHLTEIRNAHLFMEYLMSSGIKSPRSRSEDWELVDKEQVIARIKKIILVLRSSLFVQPCWDVSNF